MVEHGLYKIKDEYFMDFPHEKHIHNKVGRPFYYAVKDSSGIYWLVPLSSQVNNFQHKIEVEERKRGKGKCIRFHIGYIMGTLRAFRICDMLPVTAHYIDGAFEIHGKPYIAHDEELVTAISRKARDFIKQLELGRMYSQVDALGIRKVLESKG
jgi:hypothetical protein